MTEERELAKKFGMESPVHETIEDTHKSYNDCLTNIIGNMNQKSMMLIGSHNKDSIELAKQLINKSEFLTSRNIGFGQLKGFADNITVKLTREGFKVYKYLPYGPTEHVMPYLVRRGQESRQMLREQEFQDIYLKNEIKNRLRLRRD